MKTKEIAFNPFTSSFSQPTDHIHLNLTRGQRFLNGSSFKSVLVICLFFQVGQSVYFQKAKELKIRDF